MSDTFKKLLGPTAVAVAGLRQLLFHGLQPVKGVKITVPTTPECKHDGYTPDQVSHLSGDLLVLAAGQARQMGRMLNVCPDALLDDGLLDFTLLFGSPGSQAAALASELVSAGLSQAQGGVQLLRLPWMVVEARHDLKCNRDGEPSLPSNRLVFEVLPRRILLHLPDKRLLLEGQAAAHNHSAAHEVKAGAAAPPGAQPGAPAAAEPPATRPNKLSRQLSLSGQRWWRKQQKRAMRIGTKPRPRLLLDLWAAQQPPGRLSRLLPRLKKAAGKAAVVGGLLAAGFAAGCHW
ncbi:hypothetical protein COO60DRAFT_960408 [Scenedesmus sp. NREL 46B-D3]|nr:hypothetical protein COO60DRAFT_960408 [Scenedesmus sp. NREL 46B-D3]